MRSSHKLRVGRGVGGRDTHTDIAHYRLNWLGGRFSEKVFEILTVIVKHKNEVICTVESNISHRLY